jgi:DNA-binding transcriptional MocR family regulator
MLEQRIHNAEPGYGPGWVLPSAADLARELALGVDTITRAYRQLTQMGLVTLRERYGAVVREQRPRESVRLPAGTTVTARMPTLAEVDQWQLDPGVPMLTAAGPAWPADRFELFVGDSEPPPANTG